MQRIGAYSLVDRIATGKSSEVHLARVTSDPRRAFCAVKVFSVDASSVLADRELATRFRHPNSAEIFEVGLDGGAVFVASELVVGSTWADLLGCAARDRHPLPRDLIGWMAIQVANVLTSIHRETWHSNRALAMYHGV